MDDESSSSRQENQIREKQRRQSHRIIQGGWISGRISLLKTKNALTLSQIELANKYANYPLVREMAVNEATRTASLEEDGKKQIFYPKSNDGWLRTIFVLEGRALDRIILPWTVVTINAIVWTLIAEFVIPDREGTNLSSYESYFGLILSTSLSFLLVFRLNRSAERYWSARNSWGSILAYARTMVGGIIVHGRHDKPNRDAAIRWIAASGVATMQFIRGIPEILPGMLEGILNDTEVKELESVPHPVLYAADQIRWHLKQLFLFDQETPIGIAQGRTQQLDTLENQLNDYILHVGALERIRASPLPLVYVTHLRTFLLFFLLAMPYIFEYNLGYATIPIVFLTAFALLGLEGAAQEVEAPFMKDRTNHLSMDSFCLVMISNILQQIRQDADREIRQAQVLDGRNDETCA